MTTDQRRSLYIIIIGGGKVGFHLAQELAESTHEILLIEQDPARVAEIQEELGDIAATRERMVHGSYGECIDCGQDIRAERRQAQPTAPRCVVCQDAWDKKHGSTLRYSARLESGHVAFSDRSTGQPKTFFQLAQFTKDVAEDVCGVSR